MPVTKLLPVPKQIYFNFVPVLCDLYPLPSLTPVLDQLFFTLVDEDEAVLLAGP